MKIICIGRNYRDHAAELNNPVPDEPMVFMKPSTALLVNDKDFYIPDFSSDVHYEAEIVLRIGKNGKMIQEEFALNYIDAITIGIDFTARDLQQKCKAAGHPWEIAKSFDNSAVIGTFIDVPTGPIQFSLQRNSVTVQNGNTADLIFDFPTLMSYISRFFMLQQGDMVFTGTPAGVGKVHSNDLLEGFIGETKLLECRVK